MDKNLIWQKFVDFWKQFYDDNTGRSDKEYYDPYIGRALTEDGLQKLWQWKMQNYYDRFASYREKVSKMRGDIEYLKSFQNKKLSNGSFNELLKYSYAIFRFGNVYRVFLFHIIWPEEFIILDQHVIRAFIFLEKGELIKNTSPLIEKCSLSLVNDSLYNKYRDFVQQIHKNCKLSLRNIDKALMAFGQFLNNPKKFLKTNRPTKN